MIILKYLVAVATVALLGALALAAPASATVLCQEAKDPCPASYPVGTEIAGKLRSGEKTLFTGFEDACTESSFTAEVTKAGRSSSTVTIAFTSLSWGGCLRAKQLVKAGTMEIHHLNKSFEGRGTWTGLVYKDSFCTYTVGATGINAAIVGGSPHAELLVETTATAFGCPNQTWEAIFTVTAPSPLYVTAS
ncbi:MAG TPA: hypothetical protein VFR75_11030 [Solirubrobacterales bacterium]|nr:hypothetical protein [Solirubrobacterales bacterium]